MSQDKTAHDNPHARLWELIKDIRFGMLTHRHVDDRLHAHPLTTQNKDGDRAGTLYFFVPRSGEIAMRVRHDDSVNVSYAHPGKDSYVSVSGRATVTHDAALAERLWSKLDEAWFPQGPTDPELAILAVEIHDAEYWDVKDSKMVQLFKLARAATTGRPPQDLGEHREVHMH